MLSFNAPSLRPRGPSLSLKQGETLLANHDLVSVPDVPFLEKVMEKSHVSALRAKHDALKAKIRFELSRPMPDDLLLVELKKQKLRLKESLGGS